MNSQYVHTFIRVPTGVSDIFTYIFDKYQVLWPHTLHGAKNAFVRNLCVLSRSVGDHTLDTTGFSL